MASPSTSYQRRLPSGLVVRSTTTADAPALEALQLAVFPSLADAQRFKAPHYLRHLELFAQGQFVVEDDGRLVAATSTIRRSIDFDHPHHTFEDIIQGGWLTSHEPAGEWLYGADLGVHPTHRGRGLALALYAARQQLVWALGLRGQVTAGMLSGYGALKSTLTPEAYLAEVAAGRRTDPTLSMQLRAGFTVRALLRDHLDDPLCDNHSALIVLDAAHTVPGSERPSPMRGA